MLKINFNGIGQRLSNIFQSNALKNVFNEAFYRFVGSGYTDYDDNQKTYVENGYNVNATVYSIIQQMSTKASSVPLYIRRVANKKDGRKFYNSKLLERKLSLIQRIQKKSFETIQDDNTYLEPPLIKPNPHQNWTEFINLAYTFLRTTGNVYLYMPSVQSELASDKGEPYAIYVLPSHLIQIVLKNNADLLVDSNPVKEYILTEGNMYSCFPAEQVVHITFSNPNFDQNGSHLYGQSPLRAALKQIQTSNEANDQNIKTMKNAGVYGFVHGKSIPLGEEQASALKQRLKDMDDDAGRLSRIAGISTDIGFTRMSLTTDELKPFEFMKYTEAQIANCLGWSVLLLNNVDGAKYDNLKQIRQRVITDTIMPDLKLIEDALNTNILKRFKGYENTVAYFDFNLLPEMQADMKELVDWLTIALRDGVITRNEYREALNYEAESLEAFNEYTVQFGMMPLEDALTPSEPSLNITD